MKTIQRPIAIRLLVLTAFAAMFWSASSASAQYDVERRGIRPRLGIAGVGGVIFEGPGPAGGISGQLGMQFGDFFALYYLPTGLIGSANETGGLTRVIGTVWNTLMAEFTFGDVFQIGAGPSLDFVFGCDSFRFGNGTQTWCRDAGPYFGLDGRIAMAFGPRGDSSRGGFFIAIDGHPVFLPSLVLMTATASVGFQMY